MHHDAALSLMREQPFDEVATYTSNLIAGEPHSPATGVQLKFFSSFFQACSRSSHLGSYRFAWVVFVSSSTSVPLQSLLHII